MTEKEIEHFERLRQKVFAYIKKYFDEGGDHHKSYEGAWSLNFPNYFEEDNFSAHLSCYLLGPHRGYDWEGKSWSEVFSKAEKDIDAWIRGENMDDTELKWAHL